jgi:GMP synthase-like glutamine amidotransferase
MGLHIGILQTDHVLPRFRETHGDYDQMFQALITALEPSVAFSVYDTQLAVPDEIVCDAYLITGSKHSVYEDLPWIKNLVAFLQQVLDAGKKIIGICFGHQLMAHYFGGKVQAASAGWAVGVQKSHVTQPAPWMSGNADSVALLSSHKDQVVVLPENAQLFLASDFCPIAGFVMGDQVIAVQSHPEFRKHYARELLLYRKDQLGDAVLQQGLASLSEPTSEQVVTRWLLDFVRGQHG